MKKALFYPALVALILANLMVYSCQKENVVTAVPVTTDQEVGDRFVPCSPIYIANGVGLGICNIDNGTGTCNDPCNPGSTTNVAFDAVIANPQGFPLANSNYFSLMNPGPNPQAVGVYAGSCAGITTVIPAGGSRVFKVTFNALTGCCEITLGC